MHTRSTLVLLATTALVGAAGAQTLERKNITAEGARKAIAAATAEATKNNWPVVITVVDEAGALVALERMDKAQRGSIEIAIGKARTAALFKRPSGLLEEATKTRPALLTAPVPDIALMQGGMPITVRGEVVGAVGVSGVKAEQDEQIAKAGADAVK